MEITEVRIKLMEDNSGSNERLQAFCSITFDDMFVIRDLKIIEGAKGFFVAMPSRKLTLQVVPPGSARSKSSTKVCGSTQRPAAPTGQSLLAAACARGSPNGTMASEKRSVKRSIAPLPLLDPALPGVARVTCGGESPCAASEASRANGSASFQPKRIPASQSADSQSTASRIHGPESIAATRD